MMAHHGGFWAKTEPAVNKLAAMKVADANAPVRLPNRNMQIPVLAASSVLLSR
jgi:hypothetical protein